MLSNLQRLRIGCDGGSLPESLSGLQRLTSLHLTSCQRMLTIPSRGQASVNWQSQAALSS